MPALCGGVKVEPGDIWHVDELFITICDKRRHENSRASLAELVGDLVMADRAADHNVQNVALPDTW
jgi:hypothetical protein